MLPRSSCQSFSQINARAELKMLAKVSSEALWIIWSTKRPSLLKFTDWFHAKVTGHFGGLKFPINVLLHIHIPSDISNNQFLQRVKSDLQIRLVMWSDMWPNYNHCKTVEAVTLKSLWYNCNDRNKQHYKVILGLHIEQILPKSW